MVARSGQNILLNDLKLDIIVIEKYKMIEK